MLAIVAVAGALTGAAHAQMGAIPRDAAAMIVDAARQARLGVSHYGMVGFDPANLALIEVIDASRRRAAGAMMGLAAVTAIERYPPLLPQIVRAVVDMAPDLRDDIVRRVVLVFPLQAARVYAAAGSSPLPPVTPFYSQTPATIGSFVEPQWTAIPAHLIEEPRPVAQVAAPAPAPALVYGVPTPAEVPAPAGTSAQVNADMALLAQPVIGEGIFGDGTSTDPDVSPVLVEREPVISEDAGEPELGPHGYPILGTPPSGGGGFDVTGRLGIGVRLEPEYEGGDEFDMVFLPIVDLELKETAYLNTIDGLGYYLWYLPNLKIGVGFDYRYGREEEDADRLVGLGEVDDTLELAANFRLRFSPTWHASAQFRRDVSGGHEGTTANLGVGYDTEITPRWRGRLKLDVEWADQDYMASFYGVNAVQASRSGLARFDPDAAFKTLAFGGTFDYTIDASWFAQVLIRFSLLTGDAADSPISESDTQILSGVGFGYKF